MERINVWRYCSAARLDYECDSYDILNAFGARIVVFRRVVRCAELDQLLERLATFDTSDVGIPTLFDLRDTDFSPASRDCIETLVCHLSALPRLQRCPGVFVVSTELGFGLLRMLQQMAEASLAAPIGHLYVTYSVPDAVSRIRILLRAAAKDAGSDMCDGPCSGRLTACQT